MPASPTWPVARGVPFHEPLISIRTGDTPQRERARFRRHPADILITTPESLYLLLTSQAAEALRTVDTVIIDEIHALVPTKRGAHLALSLERLEALIRSGSGARNRRLQRIGLSATQRPLEEVARFLGGVEIPVEDGREGRLALESTPAVSAASSEILKEKDELTQSRRTARRRCSRKSSLRYRPVTIVNASAPKAVKAAH